MKRFTFPVAAIAAAAVIGCGSNAAPVAMDATPPSIEVQPTLATATLSVTGMH